MDSTRATATISASIEALERSDEKLAGSLNASGVDEIGRAMIDYYRAVYAAERDAMRRVLAVIQARNGEA